MKEESKKDLAAYTAILNSELEESLSRIARELSAAMFGNPLTEGKLINIEEPVCECGAAKCGTTHSTWCPCYEL